MVLEIDNGIFLLFFRLVRMCTQHFGSVAANTVKTFNVDQLPLLLIITRNRSANEVANVIHGKYLKLLTR